MWIVIVGLVTLKASPGITEIPLNLPPGVLLPPKRDFFDIDVVEELNTQEEMAKCRLIVVDSPSPNTKTLTPPPVRYLVICS